MHGPQTCRTGLTKDSFGPVHAGVTKVTRTACGAAGEWRLAWRVTLRWIPVLGAAIWCHD